jgi:hypothetical protein
MLTPSTTTPTLRIINRTPNSTTLPRMPPQKTVVIVKTVKKADRGRSSFMPM